MRISTLIGSTLAALAICAGFSLPANAAQVDAAPLLPLLGEYLQVLATFVAAVLVGFVAQLARKWFGAELDSQHRAALHEAIGRGMGYAISSISKRLDEGAVIKVDNDLAASVAKYVVAHTPDALKYFSLTPDNLDDLIKARFGSLTLNSASVSHSE